MSPQCHLLPPRSQHLDLAPQMGQAALGDAGNTLRAKSWGWNSHTWGTFAVRSKQTGSSALQWVWSIPTFPQLCPKPLDPSSCRDACRISSTTLLPVRPFTSKSLCQFFPLGWPGFSCLHLSFLGCCLSIQNLSSSCHAANQRRFCAMPGELPAVLPGNWWLWSAGLRRSPGQPPHPSVSPDEIKE